MDDAATIFRRYEEIRPRLPRAVTGARSHPIGSLLDLVGTIDAFVFDAFGVLNVGDTPIPGAARRVAELRHADCEIRVLTNAASYDRSGAIDKFRRLGIALDPAEIITSRDAALQALDNRRWGIIAADDDCLHDLPRSSIRLGADAAGYEAAEGFVFLSTADWTGPQQALLEEALTRKPRPLIVGNADLVAPRGSSFSLEPGYFGHRIADLSNADVRFFGKPFADVYAMAQQTLPGIAPDRIAMIGDTLHTDILGAAAAGWRSVLVTADGLFAGIDVSGFADASGIHADWQLDRI